MRNSTSTKNTSAATRTTRTRTAPTKAPRVECLCPDCNGLVTLVRRAGRIEVLPHAVHRRIAGKVVASSCIITSVTELQATTVLAVTRAVLAEALAELTEGSTPAGARSFEAEGARKALAEFDAKRAEFQPSV